MKIRGDNAQFGGRRLLVCLWSKVLRGEGLDLCRGARWEPDRFTGSLGEACLGHSRAWCPPRSPLLCRWGGANDHQNRLGGSPSFVRSKKPRRRFGSTL